MKPNQTGQSQQRRAIAMPSERKLAGSQVPLSIEPLWRSLLATRQVSDFRRTPLQVLHRSRRTFYTGAVPGNLCPAEFIKIRERPARYCSCLLTLPSLVRLHDPERSATTIESCGRARTEWVFKAG